MFTGFLNTSRPRNRLMEFSRNLAGNRSTGPDLVSTGVNGRPDLSRPYVVKFGCGKVQYLGGRGEKMKKRGRMCGA